MKAKRKYNSAGRCSCGENLHGIYTWAKIKGKVKHVRIEGMSYCLKCKKILKVSFEEVTQI